MNVASLEICQQLYELSEWNDTHSVYYSNAGKYSAGVQCKDFVFDKPANIPAYDLGYLIRKLDGFDVRLDYSNQWRRWYCWHDKGMGNGAYADTPEDAACKLAIELFKQGVLTRNQGPQTNG